jgi:hypothetical protein
LYAQYIAQILYTNGSRYQTVNFNFDFWYSDALINLEKIIEMNTNEETREDAASSGSNQNQIAVARILKSFYYHFITDRWGPIPYTEALQGRVDFKPIYDSQETIYQGIFTELSAAVQQIDGGDPVKGDILMEGDMNRWKRFANSIRMIAALRISKVDPVHAKKEFVDAFTSGVLESNHDNVMYPFLPESNNENPWFTNFLTQETNALSNTLVNRLLTLQDPRLRSFGDTTISSGGYQGMPYGINNPTEDPADLSLPHSVYVRGQDTPLPLMTYAQLLFCMTEAAQLGWINTNPETLYYDAIKASMEQWNAFEPEVFEAYILQPEVKWDQVNAESLIGEQKWIALFPQGYESWAEWRRTGYPDLQPAPDALNQSKRIPLRQGYPTTERDLNEQNWRQAIDTWFDGSDGLDGRLWWDVD